MHPLAYMLAEVVVAEVVEVVVGVVVVEASLQVSLWDSACFAVK